MGQSIYRWDNLKESGYAWWIDRFRAVLTQADVVRLDHFRGFGAYWEIPAGETTAMNGRWVKGPGAALFRAVEARRGKLPIIAENLDVITPEVEAIRQEAVWPLFGQRDASALCCRLVLALSPKSPEQRAWA